MFTTLPASGVLGRGFLLQSAPLGAPQRTLNARFRRALRQSRQSLPLPSVARAYATVHELITRDDPPSIEDFRSLPDSAFTGNYLSLQNAGSEIVLRPTAVRWIFAAIRAGDPWRAYRLVVQMNAEETDQLTLLPATEFAELVRCLDPVLAHDRLDPLDGLRISPAMLGHGFADNLVDASGAREVYTRLFSRLMFIVDERVDAGLPTPPSVFTVLFRLAGASSQPEMADRIFEKLKHASAAHWADWNGMGDANVLNEYLKARFLTEPLYYQHDRERVRVRPLNVERQILNVTFQQRRKLNQLKLRLRAAQPHRFGADPGDESQSLHERICSRTEIRRAMPVSRLKAAGLTEDLICTAIVASTRSGSSHLVRFLLKDIYGIATSMSKETGECSFSGGVDVRPNSPVRPTAKLLMALARALGANGEVDLSLQLIPWLSHRYNIPVPSEVWSEWMEWSYVHSGNPAQLEWKIIGNARRVNSARMLLSVAAELGRGAGHAFTPGFDDHVMIARRLLESHRFVDAWVALRDARRIYEGVVARAERAAVRAAAAAAQGIPMPSFVGGKGGYRELQKERDVKRHNLVGVCRALLKAAGRAARYRTGIALELQLVDVLVPQFVEEFSDLMPDRMAYHTATGTVRLQNPIRRVIHKRKMVHSPVTSMEYSILRPRDLAQDEAEGAVESEEGAEAARDEGHSDEEGAWDLFEKSFGKAAPQAKEITRAEEVAWEREIAGVKEATLAKKINRAEESTAQAGEVSEGQHDEGGGWDSAWEKFVRSVSPGTTTQAKEAAATRAHETTATPPEEAAEDMVAEKERVLVRHVAPRTTREHMELPVPRGDGSMRWSAGDLIDLYTEGGRVRVAFQTADRPHAESGVLVRKEGQAPTVVWDERVGGTRWSGRAVAARH
ncbi:uncharacterized protein DNG_05763 [Cephalotrichum gorgonifer]|uniref:Uncharacterized protein n=1 Tax=Cephalotrichum gorgonifer TaxID=2041049 RepID=A0AAE8MYW2_9PEZI|nr:uncharacterized protein DNG_05763 [Cephalotrichum gorgonifer]